MSSVSLNKYTQTYFGKYLEDDNINEICYNGTNKIFLQDYKAVWHIEDTLLDYSKAKAFATAVASYKNDQIKENKPILSAILTTGERVQIIMPIATKKDIISITIRKPSKKRFTLEDYKNDGMFKEVVTKTKSKLSKFDEELKNYYDNNRYKEFITNAVRYGKNIVIAGETGSGKTTFMKSLIDFIPEHERIITIEDVEEIKFYQHQNYVQLFYPSEAKQEDFLNSATLLKSCLRMKPDRILLAELRGAETYDFLNVINSGHNGSITSCHAGSVEETFRRLALMILQNSQGQKLPYDVIQSNLHDSIDIVIHMHAYNGSRNITDIYYKGA